VSFTFKDDKKYPTIELFFEQEADCQKFL